jgi:hypothetical protein
MPKSFCDRHNPILLLGGHPIDNTLSICEFQVTLDLKFNDLVDSGVSQSWHSYND